MCFKYIRRYNCPQGNGRSNAEHVLSSTVPCSNPIPCVGDGFGVRNVSFSGSCEQHTSPNAWAAFSHSAADGQSTFTVTNPQDLSANITRYIDNLLDLVTVLMNEALPKSLDSREYVSLQSAVDTIARELRCPRCQDDITVCPCSPGQNRAMYNISRVFRTAEAQRVLPNLRHRFGEETLRQAAQQSPSYAAAPNLPEPQTRVFYDVDPPTHESAVVKSRTQREAIAKYMGRRERLFAAHPEELGRVQWSALHIIGSYLTFDNGVPVELADYIGRTLVPMLYPTEAFHDTKYRFGFNIDSGKGSAKSLIRSQRLTDENFWTNYQDMIQEFESLVRRNDDQKRDLNAIAIALDNRMEDIRNTFHDLLVEERVAFSTIAKDLLPVTQYVPMEELEHNQQSSTVTCLQCGLPFSHRLQEPRTPAVAEYAVCNDREQQVHSGARYLECAVVPTPHAFCMREWSRQLMVKGANNTVTGIKEKEQWRCNTCFVDPWRAG